MDPYSGIPSWHSFLVIYVVTRAWFHMRSPHLKVRVQIIMDSKYGNSAQDCNWVCLSLPVPNPGYWLMVWIQLCCKTLAGVSETDVSAVAHTGSKQRPYVHFVHDRC